VSAIALANAGWALPLNTLSPSIMKKSPLSTKHFRIFIIALLGRKLTPYEVEFEYQETSAKGLGERKKLT
jgi:hypothetical protein